MLASLRGIELTDGVGLLADALDCDSYYMRLPYESAWLAAAIRAIEPEEDE